jgi:hypothetical protein
MDATAATYVARVTDPAAELLPPRIPSSQQRFTLDGGDKLETHLEQTCQVILKSVRGIVSAKKLEGVLLGGGYGRGEGGVLKTEAGDRPYNDLEFYVFLRGNNYLNERRFRAALRDLGDQLTPVAGVDVEFKILTLAKLRRSPVTMFYYDLVTRHHRLWGDEALLAGCDHHRDGGRIPLYEATRLLMNRCSGLLFAKERLQRDRFTHDDADFVSRNLAKVQLAFGDVVLTVNGQYHWSCRERHQRLMNLSVPDDLPWLAEVRDQHAVAVQFKLHPVRTDASRSQLLVRHEELTSLGLRVWLWLESRRLAQSIASARDYALTPANKCPETNAWRNRMVNAVKFGPAMILAAKASRYPRERLLHSMTMLLWEPSFLSNPDLMRRMQANLRTDAGTFPDFVRAYTSLWRHFN